KTALQVHDNWAAVATKLQKSTDDSTLATAISELFGHREATQQALATVKDPKAPIEERIRATKLLSAQQNAALVNEIPKLMADDRLRLEAIRAIAAYDNENLGSLLIQRYGSLNPEEKTEAINTLSSRPRYGGMLVTEIKENRIPKREIS